MRTADYEVELRSNSAAANKHGVAREVDPCRHRPLDQSTVSAGQFLNRPVIDVNGRCSQTGKLSTLAGSGLLRVPCPADAGRHESHSYLDNHDSPAAVPVVAVCGTAGFSRAAGWRGCCGRAVGIRGNRSAWRYSALRIGSRVRGVHGFGLFRAAYGWWAGAGAAPVGAACRECQAERAAGGQCADAGFWGRYGSAPDRYRPWAGHRIGEFLAMGGR